MVVVCAEHKTHFFFCGGHDLLSVDVVGDGGIDLLRTSVAPLAHGSGRDQTQHVKV